jgi:hypothetical protein
VQRLCQWFSVQRRLAIRANVSRLPRATVPPGDRRSSTRAPCR